MVQDLPNGFIGIFIQCTMQDALNDLPRSVLQQAKQSNSFFLRRDLPTTNDRLKNSLEELVLFFFAPELHQFKSGQTFVISRARKNRLRKPATLLVFSTSNTVWLIHIAISILRKRISETRMRLGILISISPKHPIRNMGISLFTIAFT